MAKGMVDIRGFGNKALERSLRRFGPLVQRKLVRRTTKESTERLKDYVAVGLARHRDTGELLASWVASPVGPLKRRAGVQGHGVARPPTKELAIRLNVLEYGYKHNRTGRFIPAKAPVRTAVNENQSREISLMQQQLKREIEKEWRAMARKLAKVKLG